MAIAYQPAMELAEVRKRVDGWHVLPALPAKVLRSSPCDDEVSAWFSDNVVWVLAADCVVPSAPTVSVKQTENTLKQRFLEQAQKWDRETAYLSSTPKMVLHDSYQTIMAMGPDVVPFLLEDLRDNRRSWFWALRHLTHANPVTLEDQGNLDKMIAAWVAWGIREGKI
jgi:hypothetical protein